MGICHSRSLELLYGVDPEVLPGGPEVVVRMPFGFRVVEVGVPRGGSWSLYVVRRAMMSSVAAARRLARAAGCRLYSIAGLKDACAVVVQYVALKCRGRPPSSVEAGGLRAVLAGSSPRLAPGIHRGNVFKIWVDGPPHLCSRLEGLRVFPGFYGPQRFGVSRPNSHIYGLHLARGSLDGLLREASYRYPWEARSCPGSYERVMIREPWRAAEVLPRVAVEALQSYIFNRALSEVLGRGEPLWRAAEAGVHASCGGSRFRVPAARLPHPRLLESRSLWARIVVRIAEEEGVDLKTLKGLKPSLRPLAYPLCRLKCRRVESSLGSTLVRVMLPPGAYATVMLRSVAPVDWEESYRGCGAAAP